MRRPMFATATFVPSSFSVTITTSWRSRARSVHIRAWPSWTWLSRGPRRLDGRWPIDPYAFRPSGFVSVMILAGIGV